MSDKAHQLCLEAHSAITAGNYELSEHKYSEAIALDPTNKNVRLDKGVSLERQGRVDDALREFDRLLEWFPDFGTAWTYKATLLNNRKLFAEAEMCAENALRLNISDGNAWGQKGIALEMQHKFNEAMTCYEGELRWLPATGWAKKGALLAFEFCDYENAIKCFEKALKWDKNCEIAWNGKGAAYFSQGMFEEAIECYDTVLTKFPDDTEMWNNKGIVLIFQGKFEEAEQCFQKAALLDPSSTELNYLGFLNLHQGRFQDALQWFEKASVNVAEKDFSLQGKALCEYLMANPRPPACPDPTGKSLQKLSKLNQIELYFFKRKNSADIWRAGGSQNGI